MARQPAIKIRAVYIFPRFGTKPVISESFVKRDIYLFLVPLSMRAALIIPKTVRAKHPMIYCVPQTLGQLAAVTPEDVELTTIDENVQDIEGDFDLVGISVRTQAVPRAVELTRELQRKGSTVVWGGIHPTGLYHARELDVSADAVGVGAGERLWPEIIRDFQKGELRPVYRAQGTPPIVHPLRDVFDYDVPYLIDSVSTSRGCKYADCSFCSLPLVHGKGFVNYSPDWVGEELADARDRILIADDNFMNRPQPTLEAVLARMEASGKRFCVQLDPHSATNDWLPAALFDAGVRVAMVAFESVNPENFARSHKYVEPARWEGIIERFNDAGIAVDGSFVLGLAYDREDVFGRTADMVCAIGLRMAGVHIATPYPGTPFYADCVQQKALLHRDWSRYDCRHAVFRHPSISPDVLEAGRKLVVSACAGGFYAGSGDIFS